MKQFRLINGNRLEMLADVLSEIVKTPVASPLEPEVFVVQSQGMATWLSIELSRRLGISANFRFFHPNQFLQFAFEQLLPDYTESLLDNPNVVTWILMDQLPEIATGAPFDKIRQYLQDDFDGLKLFQVAERLADTFDQYLVFRPEMILDWESGKDDDWQACLWRKLAASGSPLVHRARCLKTLVQQYSSGAAFPESFPKRITIFGISSLPRFHMELFDCLANHIPVNLFLMNPCREFWGEIVSPQEMSRKRKDLKKPGADDELYLDQGNPLLSALGKMGRDFFNLVHTFGCVDIPVFEAPGKACLLHRIQTGILDLEGREAETAAPERIADSDTSVSIHSCHSPMREVEVLHNYLLACFERYPDLTPNNILVMTPDIEAYAPYIEAVFHQSVDDPQWMPYRIADRSMLHESILIQTFFDILDLHTSRFRLTDVMNILEAAPIQNRFGLTHSDLEQILHWAEDTRIHWGVNAAFREKLNLPKLSQNTWQAGLERLFLGYAMLGDDEQLIQGRLPSDPVEGQQAEALGTLAHLLHLLFTFSQSFEIARTIPEWIRHLRLVMDTFFPVQPDAERDLQAFRDILNEMGQNAEAAGFFGKVSISVVQNNLQQTMKSRGFGTGFISGGITFSAMLPMRSIPSDVICLLGMNHDAYPRQSRFVEFDRIAKHPRPGDRSRRHDDQYLFLEAILSSRRELYISYIGRSIQDNSILPPSVMVSELLEYITNRYTTSDGAMTDPIVTDHKLQPFHPDYFTVDSCGEGPAKYYSYSEADCVGASCMIMPRKHPKPFFDQPLEPDRIDTIDRIIILDFFRNPCRFLVRHQMGICLPQDYPGTEDRELFDLKGLERFWMAQPLVDRQLQGEDPQAVFEINRSRGALPHMKAGEVCFETLASRTHRFSQNLKPFVAPGKQDPISLSIKVEGIRIVGKIDTLYGDQNVIYRFGQLTGSMLLSTWIDHLLLSAGCPETLRIRTVAAGLPAGSKNAGIQTTCFEPIENAAGQLEVLLRYLKEGCRKPLKFYPNTAYRFAGEAAKPKVSLETALLKAGQAYLGNNFVSGEGQDLYYRFCLQNDDPLDEMFQQAALDIFQPLLQAMVTC